jgi:hypothetical protein
LDALRAGSAAQKRAESRTFPAAVSFPRSCGDLGEMCVRPLLFKRVSEDYFRAASIVAETGEVTDFVYTVWFRDPAAEPDDQDCEWCACLNINSSSPEAAQAWGDFLAKRRSANGHLDIFIKSAVEPNNGAYELVSLRDGEEVTDEFLGW